MIYNVWDWEKNGYMDTDGKKVKNRFIGKLHHMIEEGRGSDGFKTKFWLVRAEENEEAVPLAEEAFMQDDGEEEEDDEPPCGLEVPLDYWIDVAPEDRDAKELSRRLKIKLHSLEASEYDRARASVEATAAIRRLVITGEDRKQNFERLFGQDWIELLRVWTDTRLEVLRETRGVLARPNNEYYDADAPFYRPRKPNVLEAEKLDRMVGMSYWWELLEKQSGKHKRRKFVLLIHANDSQT
jgi:hypothetical protein